MKLNITEYEYEGTAEVVCNQCGDRYEIAFYGNDIDHPKIENAIEEAMLEQGWQKGICPTCLEESEDDESTDTTDSDEL